MRKLVGGLGDLHGGVIVKKSSSHIGGRVNMCITFKVFPFFPLNSKFCLYVSGVGTRE